MIKIMGAILIIGGTVAVGLRASQRLKNRVSTLSAIINSLEIMQSEIYFKLTPIPEIMERLSKTMGYPVNGFYERCLMNLHKTQNSSFAVCFTSAVRDTPELSLNSFEEQALLDLSNVLGRYDAEGQSRAINYAIKRFEIYLKDAREEYKNQGRVYRALGVVCGVVSVIVLI